ncbi:precorrin-6A synthase (deacetylating) [Actinokineospora globicatena]|uniref:Precorrin-6A synthase (Deacetylating) n=1 Tax=Actinokineospora globicatena TaxID=103729 RepID=A0A9W6V5S6_9PSEU|nr:precorrin-6A synthase (deacetylating) [Actinokineospora globicatena]MCP2304511.1 precorrin-6A synthase (deacetylating) [Actinokineospora globicatena]GLW78121.1 precorrin-6A synthase (deacetylating) [Actinokineospora globicatena]GLW85213.1 precorrin-6A synthase (deacetylating) [Actinokineospora globicatena]GLW90725.1 precorrin-6A synthase (deacetylating) [Actinokineospora globicatena]
MDATRVEIIGIGAGDPDHVTVGAVAAMTRADVFFFLDKPDAAGELSDLRQVILDAHVPAGGYRLARVQDPQRVRTEAGYGEAVADWRKRRADACERLIADNLAPGETGAFLVWGDPSLYDSIISVVDDIRARGNLEFEVLVHPGISSVSALAARCHTTLNQVGGAVQVTTGRRLEQAWPDGVDDVVVMLDARDAYLAYANDPDIHIHWGAYVGTADEIIVSGPLSEVAEQIRDTREKARQDKGWIMDTYLLRRKRSSVD